MFSHRKQALTAVLIALIAGTAALGISCRASANNWEHASIEDVGVYTKGAIISNGYMEANSNRQVHTFSTEPVASSFTTEGFDKVCETDKLQLWLNREKGALRVLNLKTGYLWGALPLEDAEGLNSTWNCYGNSLAAIECFDDTGKESRVSIGKDGEADYSIDGNVIICKLLFKKVGIGFSVRLELNDNCLNMSVVHGTLQEGLDGSTYRLKSMTFIPFLGASYSDNIDGYMLIPDGSGALIRFRQPANYSSTYNARVYGKDLGIEALSSASSEYAKEEPQVLMPIYGMVHGAGQNGFLAVIDKGAEYTSIVSTPALTNNPYNWTAARFEYRQKYTMNINRKDGAGAVVPQEHINQIDPVASFYFLDGEKANYDGMAVFYRELLEDQGILSHGTIAGKSMPLQLEVLGADKKKEFIGTSTTLFTSAEQAGDIVRKLSQEDITRLSLIYKCYTRNNEAGGRLLTKVGSSKQFKELEQLIEGLGGRLYYYLDPVTANKDQITQRTEAANNLSNMAITFKRSGATQMDLMYSDVYLYRLAKTAQLADKALDRTEYGNGFAIDELSYRLYGDFTSGKEHTRKESLQQVVDIVEKLTSKEKLPMYEPNQYLWQYASEMYSLPLTNSQLLYESDTVPFLQLVLSGSVELFASPMNTSSSSRERILRHIEYGMAPSFVVTECDSMQLYLTAQEEYSSTCFDDWKGQIVQDYRTIDQALSSVHGSRMISHRAVSEGIIHVTYENGVSIYINYTSEGRTIDGVAVEANWYKVVN